MPDLIVRSLGLQPYMDIWEAMKTFTAERDERVTDELWCLQHPRVYTQGQAGKPSISWLRGTFRWSRWIGEAR